MIVDIANFDTWLGIAHWAVVMLVGILLACVVGLVSAYSAFGSKGAKVFTETLTRGVRDLVKLSWTRIWGVTILTFKEAQRRKAFMTGLIFLLLFMFGGWFLGNSGESRTASPFIAFVMTAMSFLLIVMALLISCWGIPADIKARSIHTVVTKPVRRSEIIIGRMLGYTGVLTLVLLVTAICGYLWILQKVPAAARDQLIARVPHYGAELKFLDRTGTEGKGINVGDIWNYREFIEGGTDARATWTFQGLDVAKLRKQNEIRFEQFFEAFRTYKGDVNQQLRYTLTLVNPETGAKVPVGMFPVQEHAVKSSESTVVIPAEITYRDNYDIDAMDRQVNLFDDVIVDGKLIVEVGAVESQQYIGINKYDLFVRMPDRTFLSSFSKATFGLWLLLVLITIIGTTASSFVKGPVATILTASLIFVGFVFKGAINKTLTALTTPEGPLGGGSLEATYRLVTQMNETSPLPEGVGTTIIKTLDQGVFGMLHIVNAVIPDLAYFSTAKYPANGFDVPWGAILLPSIAITAAFIIPCIIVGYFSLQLRELEHK